MAKISALPALAYPSGDETVPVLIDGETRRARLGALLDPYLDATNAAADRAVAAATLGLRTPYPVVNGKRIVLARGIDADGYVAGAVGAGDAGDSLDRTAFDDGPAGARDVLVIDGAQRAARVTYLDGDNRQPRLAGDLLAWVSGSAAAVTRRTLDLSRRPRLLAGITDLLLLPWYGQSNSTGFVAGALDLDPLDPGRAISFSERGSQLGPAYVDPTVPVPALDDSAFAATYDLRGAEAERRGLGMRAAHALLAASPASTGVLVSSHGIGGRAYASLRKGTVPYANLLRTLVAGKLQAWSAGMSARVPALIMVHGEDNYADASATYQGYLAEFGADILADVRAICLDPAASPKILLAQPSSWTNYGAATATSGVPLGQMAAMLADPALYAVFTPLYFLPYAADGIHLAPEGNRRLDALAGRAGARVLRGGDGAGLYATGATRDGTSVTVDLHVPDNAALAIDTALVSDPGQLGLVYRDAGGASVAISNIAVSGSKLTLTLARAVAGTLGFALEGVPGAKAGPTTGPRCCIRTISTDIAPDGTPLHDWMAHCAVAVA